LALNLPESGSGDLPIDPPATKETPDSLGVIGQRSRDECDRRSRDRLGGPLPQCPCRGSASSIESRSSRLISTAAGAPSWWWPSVRAAAALDQWCRRRCCGRFARTRWTWRDRVTRHPGSDACWPVAAEGIARGSRFALVASFAGDHGIPCNPWPRLPRYAGGNAGSRRRPM